MRIQIEQRELRRVCTDPQRRCYNGAFAKSELQWTPWDWVEWNVKPERVEERLKFWRELGAYSVTVGGTPTEYRAITVED